MQDSQKNSIRFWKSLFMLTDLMRSRTLAHKAFIRDSRLTLQQLRLLRVVERWTRLHSPEGVMLKTIAQELEVTPAAVSGMVETLVSRDVLIRVQDREDRRSVRIRLSRSCRDHIKELEDQLGEVSERMAEGIGGDLFEKLTGELEYMVSRFEEVVPDDDHVQEKSNE